MDKPKVSLLADFKKDDKAAALEEMRRSMPAMLEYQRAMAKLQREAYVAYIKEGFTAKQAIELCKAIR